MRSLHNTLASSTLFAGDLVGFTAGLLIAILLLALTLRARKLPGTRTANIVFALCALCWTVGGLARVLLTAAGFGPATSLQRFAETVQFTGAAAFPVPVLMAWQPFALHSWQRIALRCLKILAMFSAVVVASAVLYGADIERLATANAGFVLLAGALVTLRPRSTPGPVFLPSLVMVSAVTLAAIEPAMDLLPLIVLCAFFLFARFRYADIFVRHSLRILLAAGFALVLAVTAHWIILSRASGQTLLTPSVHVYGITLLAAILMVLFAFADEPLNRLVNRWLFHSPDYRTQSRRLAETLRALRSEAEVASAVEDSTRRALAVEGVRLSPLDGVRPSELPQDVLDGEALELRHDDPLRSRFPMPNVEFLIPVGAAGKIGHLLLISPGADRPALVTSDLNYLRSVAAQCGARLDALREEAHAVERRSREALLLQQVTDAELRALRSQVNPHFLFNSLNTIADLIVRDPVRAEEMTLRLADVFRHVLAHSSRSLTSVGDEMDFVRTYLGIEEMRFRDRLEIDIAVDPGIAGEQIPSLILQPLVENALKHGLAPKPGPVHLWISARAEGEWLQLRVEDDGVGLNGPASRHQNGTHGLGLPNVAERLSTLYRDRAALILEPREGGGSRAILRIPHS